MSGDAVPYSQRSNGSNISVGGWGCSTVRLTTQGYERAIVIFHCALEQRTCTSVYMDGRSALSHPAIDSCSFAWRSCLFASVGLNNFYSIRRPYVSSLGLSGYLRPALELAPAPQAERAGRSPPERARAARRLRHRVALARRGVRAAGEVAVRARAARAWRLRLRERVGADCNGEEHGSNDDRRSRHRFLPRHRFPSSA